MRTLTTIVTVLAGTALLAFALLLTIGLAAGWQFANTILRRNWRVGVRLPDPCLYLQQLNVDPGTPFELCVHSTSPAEVLLQRCGADGWVDIGPPVSVPATKQQAKLDIWNGMGWPTTVTIPTTAVPPGQFRFVVRHVAPANNNSNKNAYVAGGIITGPATGVLVLSSTNTWHAYNDFGGLSNYTDHASPLPFRPFNIAAKLLNMKIRIADRHHFPVVPLAEHRPNSALQREATGAEPVPAHLLQGEVPLIALLERTATPYSVLSDRRFAHCGVPTETQLVICNTHAEYWSYAHLSHVRECGERGISVAVLSGNSAFRICDHLEHTVTVIEQISDRALITGVLGAYYDAPGFLSSGAYVVTDADHWLFAGTGLHAGETFGAGASGFETDTSGPAAHGFLTVARGDNVEGPAVLVVKDLPGGAFVLNTSSVAFTSRCDDPVIAQLIANMVTRASGSGVSK